MAETKNLRSEFEDIMEAIMIYLGPELSSDIEEGITEWHFVVMKLLHYEERTAADLSEYLGITPGAVTSLLDRMYQADLVQRIRDKDTDMIKFSLTDKGVLTFKKCWDKRDNLMRKILLLVDDADQAKLIEIFSKSLLAVFK